MTEAAKRFVERLSKGRGRHAPMAYIHRTLRDGDEVQVWSSGRLDYAVSLSAAEEAEAHGFVVLVPGEATRGVSRYRITPAGRDAVRRGWEIETK